MHPEKHSRPHLLLLFFTPLSFFLSSSLLLLFKFLFSSRISTFPSFLCSFLFSSQSLVPPPLLPISFSFPPPRLQFLSRSKHIQCTEKLYTTVLQSCFFQFLLLLLILLLFSSTITIQYFYNTKLILDYISKHLYLGCVCVSVTFPEVQ